MKTIGLLGGTSYPSTIIYYKRLNQIVNEQLGGFHSCRMILYNIDYHNTKSRYKNEWEEIPNLLKKEIEELLKCRPDCLLICNNTLHKAFDLIKNELLINIPVFHILDLTKRHIQNYCLKNVLLLGTKFTMEDGFFQEAISGGGVNVGVPVLEDRIKIQEIQSQLATGDIKKEFKDYFKNLLEKYNQYQGIILACTELPLVFDQLETKVKIINTIELQCQAAINFSLNI